VDRLHVDSDPTLYLTTIAVNVPLHLREAAAPNLDAALVMFRRAANYIARIEDALVFNGRPAGGPPPFGIGGIPPVFDVHGGGGAAQGLLGPVLPRPAIHIPAPPPALGEQIVVSIIQAINQLDGGGQLGPFGCALSPPLFEAICTPASSLVLPRDRVLPFLQGPLLRSSAIQAAVAPGAVGSWGVVVALSGNPVEIVVATEIQVRFLQMTEEPRLLFRVSERVALRIKEPNAIQPLVYP
jgi:hypothetical protein